MRPDRSLSGLRSPCSDPSNVSAHPDILLAHSHFLCDDPAERRIMKPYVPLGLLYLSSFLKQRGLRVEVFDGTFASPSAFEAALDDLRPRAVGISCNLGTKFSALRMITQAQQRGLFTILGGPEPATYAREYLNGGADCIVIGEGEFTLDELVRQPLARGTDCLGDIPGIAFTDKTGALVRTESRPPILALSELRRPDRDAVDIGHYMSTWRRHHGYAPVSLICARGCPYRCTWCSHSVFGHSHRRRLPAEVVDEVEQIRSAYSPDALWFADDVFNMNARWLCEFRDEMVRRCMVLPFECTCRADCMDQRVVEALRDLRCKRVWIGAESGSQRILDAMQRGLKIEQVRQAAALVKAAEIEVGTFIMLGYYGERLEDIEATVEHLREMESDYVLTTLAYPIKGTEYSDSVSQRVSNDLPWASRTDRDLRVNGSYPQAFHEMSKCWVNSEVELFRARRSLARHPLIAAHAYLRARLYRYRVRRYARLIESPNHAPFKKPGSRSGVVGANLAGPPPGITDSSTAFDSASDHYDEMFTETVLGRWLRRGVWERLAEVVLQGHRVLELNGGTGEDACWLARRTAHVTCTDASPRMLEVAARKIADNGLEDRISLQLLDLNDLPLRGRFAGPFEAVVSNFGGLNCVVDRRRLADWLAERTQPGAHVILTVMGPFCPWEMAIFGFTRPTQCLRRWRRNGVAGSTGGGATVPVFYPSPSQLTADFGRWFERVKLTGLGVVLPPTQWHSIVETRPRLLDALAGVERVISGHWPATWLNDHYVLEMRRRA